MGKLFNKLTEKLNINKIKESEIKESELETIETKVIYEDFVKETNENLTVKE